ncbi:DUF2911 domain-containing protein [Olleya sp. AH-315-F22]|nr:DUF2911 domain-containing protein [Olleya sp. AH-315-F22]
MYTLTNSNVIIFSFPKTIEDVVSNKPLSPKDTVEFRLNDLELEVFYNRPSKREREIFGGLVEYNKVWRTGANEATTFETNQALKIGNDSLAAVKYTLWTIPNKDSWHIIFNSKHYSWGVDDAMQAMREAEFDVINIDVQVEEIPSIVEQFTIAFDNSTDNLSLTMAWDKTKIVVPLK